MTLLTYGVLVLMVLWTLILPLQLLHCRPGHSVSAKYHHYSADDRVINDPPRSQPRRPPKPRRWSASRRKLFNNYRNHHIPRTRLVSSGTILVSSVRILPCSIAQVVFLTATPTITAAFTSSQEYRDPSDCGPIPRFD